VEQVKKAALYDTEVNAQYGEQLLTLSTCSYYTDDGRFVVVAKKQE
jgi:sortase B